MSQTKTQKEEQAKARVSLSALLKKGDEIYTLTEYTKGETDYVRTLIVIDGEGIRDITGRVSIATGIRFVNNNTRYGCALTGSGYSKAQSVVDSLMRAIDRDDLKWRTI